MPHMSYRIRGTDLPEDEDFILLRRRFEDHLDSYEEYKRNSNITHTQNMEAIAALTAATAGIVEAWRVANSFQRFVRWLSSFAILGGLIAWSAAKLPHGLINL